MGIVEHKIGIMKQSIHSLIINDVRHLDSSFAFDVPISHITCVVIYVPIY